MGSKNHPRNQFRPFVVLLLLLTAGLGCEQNTQPETMLEDYVWRLGNVTRLEVAAVETSLTTRPYPRPRDRKMNIPETRIGLLDLLDFFDCQLDYLISERNSILGRVQQPSQRLIYEAKLIAGLQACQQSLPNQADVDPDFLAQVEQLLRDKKQQWPAVFWNASFAGQEFNQLFSLGGGPLPMAAKQTTGSHEHAANDEAAVVAALAYWRRLAEELPLSLHNLDSSRLEASLKTLADTELVGRMLNSIQLLDRQLNLAAQLLEQAAAKPLCFKGRSNPRAEILHNVFWKYYAGNVQPYLAQVEQTAAAVFTELDALYRLNENITATMGLGKTELPTAMQAYANSIIHWQQPGSLWQDFLSQRERHTKAWQQLLTQCGLMPSATNRRNAQ